MSAGPFIIAALVLAAFVAGAGLGWIFYAGLYRTVRELGRARHPALLLGGSLLLRMAVLLGGFWALLIAGKQWIGNGWMALIPGLIGVIAVRTLLLRRYGTPGTRNANEQAADAAKRHKR